MWLLITVDQAPHGFVTLHFWELRFPPVPATSVLSGGLMPSYPTPTNNPSVLGTKSMPQKGESVLSKVPCGGNCSAGAPFLVIKYLGAFLIHLLYQRFFSPFCSTAVKGIPFPVLGLFSHHFQELRGI